MRTVISILAGLLLPASLGFGQADCFPYEEWTSQDGKTIVARFTKLEGEDVTLQMKKGGKRYSFSREKLSEVSNKALEEYQAAVKKELRGGEISATTIFKSVALGLAETAGAVLVNKEVSFPVTEIRIETDRRSAYLELDRALFLMVYAPNGRELFEKEKTLYSRPINKTRFDGRRSVNEEARHMARQGGSYSVRFSKEAVLEFGTVGITDGVILHP